MMWLVAKDPAQGKRTSLPWMAALLFAFLLAGCATAQPGKAGADRPFDFATDTFSYSNELVWEYFFDADGKWTSRRREPPPTYHHHCFPVAHAARNFFKFAQFDASAPIADDEIYRRLVREIVHGGDLRPATTKIIVPGYANLREFSRAREQLLKQECGGAWRSYFQRGHWRMILPFTRRHQESASEKLMQSLNENGAIVVHLVRFPQLTINHAVVLTSFRYTGPEIEFTVYDPNLPNEPGILTYDRASRTFLLPTNVYFYGGKVNVYEIYRSYFY